MNGERTFVTPPQMQPAEDRRLRDVFERPYVCFENPNDIVWDRNELPITPGAPATTGLMQIVYDNQPMFDRGKTAQCGPVRSFFARMMASQRFVRQT